MKKKNLKIFSVVMLVALLVSAFAFSSSAESSVESRALSSSVKRYFLGKTTPDLAGAISVLNSYSSNLVPMFDFSSNGIEFNLMQITDEGIYFSGSGVSLWAYTVAGGWLTDYKSIYVYDFGNLDTIYYNMLVKIFTPYTNNSQLTGNSSFNTVSKCDIKMDSNVSLHGFNMKMLNMLGLPTTDTSATYTFNCQGTFVSGDSSLQFNNISFIFNADGTSTLKFGNMALYSSSSTNENVFRNSVIHFNSIPVFLRNYFLWYSSYFIAGFPYYVHNSYNLDYMDIWALTDTSSSYYNGGKYSMDYSIAFDNSFNGYPLTVYSYFALGGGRSGAIFPGASNSHLLTPAGLDMVGSILIPSNSISDNIVPDSVYFIFTKQSTPYYDSEGFTVSKTLEYSLRDSQYDTTMFNRLDILANIDVLCNSLIDNTFYYYVRRNGNNLYLYTTADKSTYDVLSFEDLRGKRVAILAGSTCNPVWYNFCAVNGDLLVYGSGSGDYDVGYDAGYLAGKEYGEKIGFSKGEQSGYDKGYNSAKLLYGDDNGGIIGKLLSAPGDAFDSLILYESNNITVSLWDVFTTLLCASLFVWFLKMFAGG